MTDATVHVAQGCFPRDSRLRLEAAVGGRLVGEGE
jgi:hypothetical protein